MEGIIMEMAEKYMTQSDFAKMVKVSRVSVVNWMKDGLPTVDSKVGVRQAIGWLIKTKKIKYVVKINCWIPINYLGESKDDNFQVIVNPKIKEIKFSDERKETMTDNELNTILNSLEVI
jgi:hypothetical protein